MNKNQAGIFFILIALVFVGCSSLNIHEDYEDIKLDNKYFAASAINIIYRKNPKGVRRNERNEENIDLIIDTLIKTNQKRYNFVFQSSNQYIPLDHNILNALFRALERLDLEKCRVPDNIIESFGEIKEDYILIIRHTGIYVSYGDIDDEEDLISATTELLRGMPFWRDGSEHIKSCFEYLLFDKNTKKIIHYNKNVIIEDPRSRKVLKFQINNLFEDLNEL